MRAMSIFFSNEKDLTILKVSNDFRESDYVTRIDILEDAIYLLQKYHDDLMEIEGVFSEIKKELA
jgi:hypothetical protein